MKIYRPGVLGKLWFRLTWPLERWWMLRTCCQGCGYTHKECSERGCVYGRY